MGIFLLEMWDQNYTEEDTGSGLVLLFGSTKPKNSEVQFFEFGMAWKSLGDEASGPVHLWIWPEGRRSDGDYNVDRKALCKVGLSYL